MFHSLIQPLHVMQCLDIAIITNCTCLQINIHLIKTKQWQQEWCSVHVRNRWRIIKNELYLIDSKHCICLSVPSVFWTKICLCHVVCFYLYPITSLLSSTPLYFLHLSLVCFAQEMFLGCFILIPSENLKFKRLPTLFAFLYMWWRKSGSNPAH